MLQFFQKLFHPGKIEDGELGTALRARKRATKDAKAEARKVQGAALDSVDKSEATVRAIDDLLRRL